MTRGQPVNRPSSCMLLPRRAARCSASAAPQAQSRCLAGAGPTAPSAQALIARPPLPCLGFRPLEPLRLADQTSNCSAVLSTVGCPPVAAHCSAAPASLLDRCCAPPPAPGPQQRSLHGRTGHDHHQGDHSPTARPRTGAPTARGADRRQRQTDRPGAPAPAALVARHQPPGSRPSLATPLYYPGDRSPAARPRADSTLTRGVDPRPA